MERNPPPASFTRPSAPVRPGRPVRTGISGRPTEIASSRPDSPSPDHCEGDSHLFGLQRKHYRRASTRSIDSWRIASTYEESSSFSILGLVHGLGSGAQEKQESESEIGASERGKSGRCRERSTVAQFHVRRVGPYCKAKNRTRHHGETELRRRRRR